MAEKEKPEEVILEKPKAITSPPSLVPNSEPETSEKTTRTSRSKIEIVFNPFYKQAGIDHCPVCGEARRTDMNGKQFCPQPKKPDNCWVKDGV